MNAIRHIARSLQTELERAIHNVKSARSETLQAYFGLVFLAGCAGAVCLLAALPMLAASADRQRAIEATAQMERFTKALSQAKSIAPATAQTIGEIISRPEYYCARATCDAELESRNRMAREKLNVLLNSADSPVEQAQGPDIDQIEQASTERW
jgi:hypothetical protein